mgnify:CR=1 FL=1
MTITEATHALAALSKAKEQAGRWTVPSHTPMRLVDAITRVEPTWVEAVAVVQAVCAQLAPGQAAPALDTITISPMGDVSFPPAGSSDDTITVGAMGRLLTDILRSSDCPMQVWEATERARRAPAAVGTARSFGAALTCLSRAQGPNDLRQYFEAARRPSRPAGGTPTASLSVVALTARAGFVLLLVAMGGIGTGVSLGAIVAAEALGARPVALVVLAAAETDRR